MSQVQVPTDLKQVSAYKCFGGQQLQYTHNSNALGCQMRFSIFLPSASKKRKTPVLYWLSGLTCTDENFVHKAGAQQYAEKYQIAIVAPDTSPRGDGVPDDENGAYDFGLGAGFYVNATEKPWSTHYQMYDYVVNELPELIDENFPVEHTKCGIFGHSMGGHGALIIGLRNSQRFQSISAFAPICSPMNCPWGEKALSTYIGQDRKDWKSYDASKLLGKANRHVQVLVDQGTEDNFLTEQLKPELLEEAAKQSNYPITIRMHEGYDHSYFFIASFIQEHIEFHHKHLNQL